MQTLDCAAGGRDGFRSGFLCPSTRSARCVHHHVPQRTTVTISRFEVLSLILLLSLAFVEAGVVMFCFSCNFMGLSLSYGLSRIGIFMTGFMYDNATKHNGNLSGPGPRTIQCDDNCHIGNVMHLVAITTVANDVLEFFWDVKTITEKGC